MKLMRKKYLYLNKMDNFFLLIISTVTVILLFIVIFLQPRENTCKYEYIS